MFPIRRFHLYRLAKWTDKEYSRNVPGYNYDLSQGQSAQGILRLRNPNLGPNSGKRILDARVLEPNFWVEFFDSVFSSKRAPLKTSRLRNSPPKILYAEILRVFYLHPNYDLF